MAKPKFRDAIPDPNRPARWKVFVSYAHKNREKFVDDFHRCLKLKLKAMFPDQEPEERIFLSGHDLHGGDRLSPKIEEALAESMILVLLVSNASLSSNWCMNLEVPAAVKSAIPVFPVLLETTSWEEQPLGNGSDREKLGSIVCAPRDRRDALRPVDKWGNRAEAWQAVVDDLGKALLKRGPSALVGRDGTKIRAGGRKAALPPLLPYRCNQEHVVECFSAGLEATTSSSALVVLVRGHFEDCLPSFWDRLRHDHLVPFFQARRQLNSLEPNVIHWPSETMGSRRDAPNVESAVRSTISKALFDNPYVLEPKRQGAQIAERLRGKPDGVVALFGSVPVPDSRNRHGPITYLKETLESLGRILEACPEDAPLNQLVIALELVSMEADGDATWANKRRDWGTGARLQVIDLDPPVAFSRPPVLKWHRDWRLREVYGMPDADVLLSTVFPDKTRPEESIRFQTFVRRLQQVPLDTP